MSFDYAIKAHPTIHVLLLPRRRRRWARSSRAPLRRYRSCIRIAGLFGSSMRWLIVEVVEVEIGAELHRSWFRPARGSWRS